MTISDAATRVEEAIGYTFKDRSLLEAALTHASYAGTRLASNERLEFFGDAVLGMVVCEELFRRFPNSLEGELTKIKSAVVSRKTCADVAKDRHLDRYVMLGKGMCDREQLPGSLSAAVYEALVAAVYFDGGIEAAREFVLHDMIPEIEKSAASENQRNFKSYLQQYAQKHLGATPIYDLLDEKGPDHSKCFEICVVIDSHRYASAWGPSKKEAEQKAAYNALRELDVVEAEEEEEH